MQGLRELHKADRRRRILLAARALIAERGLDALTMRSLAAASEVSVPTIYNLIGDRAAVLTALMDAGGERFDALLPREAVDGRDPITTLADATATLAAVLADHRTVAAAVLGGPLIFEVGPAPGGAFGRFGATVAQALRHARRDGTLAADADALVLGERIQMLAAGSVLAWVHDHGDPERLHDDLTHGTLLVVLPYLAAERADEVRAHVDRVSRRLRRRRPRLGTRAAHAVGLLALVVALAAGCTSAADQRATPGATGTAPTAGTGPTGGTAAVGGTAGSAPGTSATPRGLSDQFGVRYCEVLTVEVGADRTRAEVWGTQGLNDCPQAAFDAIVPADVVADLGVTLALPNGPRYWVLDDIVAHQLAGSGEVRDFGGIEMRSIATVDLGKGLPDRRPYREVSVARDTEFTFDAGRTVYELTAPDGATYTMQSYSLELDPTLAVDALASLGSRLQLPEGWTYTVRVVAAPLVVEDVDGVASVIQDDLHNSYQRRTRP